ncbi:MAG: glycosyltransferase [Lewinellaceae bacterium]|nr:glycosyltransferase [Lewinellaceae bacterium]MCB9290003.1 glycosyltransferase [Lewinellaceae bacterium]
MLKNNIGRALEASAGLEIPVPSTFTKSYEENVVSRKPLYSSSPRPWMYVFIFTMWLASLAWFQPRLLSLMDMAYNLPGWIALALFIAFIDFAWLYGLYNVGVIIFALGHRWFGNKPEAALARTELLDYPAVAILYTTCNDFVEESVLSCVRQDYPNYKVYILDDSSSPEYQAKVDAFAARYPGLAEVVRRPSREGFKAGNMNYGLSRVATQEPYFAIADADEILPPDFLSKLVPVMEADPRCGFTQANHRANPNAQSNLARAMGVGVDLHWKWYQPLRNNFGFVMFLGHGALLRRKCWEEVGGFPDIVSEDLGFAIHIREKGYRGRFVEDVVCYEDFPDTVRAFRIRHMKWTRGTSEFLSKKMGWLLKAKNISWTEKLDILFPTLNLPLTLVYFLFMVNANLVLPYFFGQAADVTFVLAGQEWVLPVMSMDAGFQAIYDWDFFAITMLSFFAPVLCFIIGLAHQPAKLFRFLSQSTVLYAALSPLSSIGVLAYMVSGKAIFLVTGDNAQKEHHAGGGAAHFAQRLRASWRDFLAKSHPDTPIVQAFEVLTGLLFAIVCLQTFQISFFGLCLAFILLPLMHHLGWNNRAMRVLMYLPFILILLGVFVASLSLFGLQSVFFGYGFHF